MSNPIQPIRSTDSSTTEPDVGMPATTSTGPGRKFHFQRMGIVLCSLIFVVLIGYFSPNFDFKQANRSEPLGGDLLQEWIGGHVILNGDGAHLYGNAKFKQLQHDQSLTGFSWDESKYFPAVYPPFYYLIVSPLSLVPYHVAIWIWLVFNGLCLAAICMLGRRILATENRSYEYLILVAIGLFAPTILCITTGQKPLLLLLILSSTYWLLKTDRPLLAGLVFGFIAFKPHLALVIGITMLVKRQWSFVAGAISVATFFAVVSLCMGWGYCNGFVQTCLGMADYVSTGGYQLTNAHSLWGSLELLVGGYGSIFVKGLAVAIGLVVVFVLSQIMRGELVPASKRFALQFSAMVIVTILLSPHFYFYDLVIFLLPVLLIVKATRGQSTTATWIVNCVSILFVLAAAHFLIVAEWTSVQPSIVLMISALLGIYSLIVHYEKPRTAIRLETYSPPGLSENLSV